MEINFPIDMVKRTKANLARYKGEFEVTNLINCTLGLIILPYEKDIRDRQLPHPWNTNLNEVPNLPNCQIHRFEPIRRIERDGTRKYYEKTLQVFLKKIRNGLAHQNIEPVNENRHFLGVVIKNYFDDSARKKGDPDLHVQFSAKELEQFALFIADEYLKLYFEVGQECVVDPITRRMKRNRGRRCSIIEIVTAPASWNTMARVRYVGINRVGGVELSDLRPR
jgi:hypothetical protein